MVSSILFVTSLMWIRRAINRNERRICSLPWQYPKIFTNLKSIRSCSFCRFLSFRFFRNNLSFCFSEKLSWMYHTKREHLSFLVKNLVIKSRSNHELSTVKWDSYHTISTRLRRKEWKDWKERKIATIMVRSKENEDGEGRKVEDEPDDLTIVR